jgi:hypothetical protein
MMRKCHLNTCPVGVATHQFGDSRCVSGGDFENIERAGSQLLDKAQLRCNAAPSKQQVAGFGHDRAGGDEAFLLCCDVCDALLRQRVMAVAREVPRPAIGRCQR